MKTIVVSAVNLNVGGTLKILKDCLSYLSELAGRGDYKVVVIVHKKNLVEYPHVQYIENQWPKKRWVNRLWYEYVSMRKISKNLGPVYLWLSLHDTTPTVVAERRAVYCHNPFPFYRWSFREIFFAPKIVLFSLFSKNIYQKNIHRNKFVIVQQQWIKEAFKSIFRIPQDRIIVALPDSPKKEETLQAKNACGSETFTFIFASSANSHKNFEIVCEAAGLVEKQIGSSRFKVLLTLKGDENKYAKWLRRKWQKRVTSLEFIGFQDRNSLFGHYIKSNCLIFPSKVETWGLPISEFKAFDKPMLLADLPYAHETASEAAQVSFFDPDRPDVLAEQMMMMIDGDTSFLREVPKVNIEEPVTGSWGELFELLLEE